MYIIRVNWKRGHHSPENVTPSHCEQGELSNEAAEVSDVLCVCVCVRIYVCVCVSVCVDVLLGLRVLGRSPWVVWFPQMLLFLAVSWDGCFKLGPPTRPVPK